MTASATWWPRTSPASRSIRLNGRSEVEPGHAQRPDDDAIPDERQPDRDHRPRDPGRADVLREPLAGVVVVDDHRSIADGAAGDALAGPDLGAGVGLVRAAAHRPDRVAAGGPIEHGEDRDVRLEHAPDAVDDRRIEGLRVEAPGDRRPELGQALEEVGPLGQRSSLTSEGKRRRQPVADEQDRSEVGLVERPTVGLDVDHPEQGVVDDQRHADLARHVAGGIDEVRVMGDVGDELGPAVADHPADDADASVEGLDRLGIPALGPEPERCAVDEVDRDVAVAEILVHQVHDLLERIDLGATRRERPPDRLDGLDLAGPPAPVGHRLAQPLERLLERRHRPPGADDEHDADRAEDHAPLDRIVEVLAGQERGPDVAEGGQHADRERLTTAEGGCHRDDRDVQGVQRPEAGVSGQVRDRGHEQDGEHETGERSCESADPGAHRRGGRQDRLDRDVQDAGRDDAGRGGPGSAAWTSIVGTARPTASRTWGSSKALRAARRRILARRGIRARSAPTTMVDIDDSVGVG